MSENFVYDANGNIGEKTDFNNDKIIYEYDENNRLIKKTYPDASEVSFTYTPAGQRETVTDARGVTEYDYDLRDRLKEVRNPDGSIISYTYDDAGNRISVSVPSGTTSYVYDVLNRLEKVIAPDGGETIYTYDKVGNRKSVSYPNGTSAEYMYDRLNRLIRLENRNASGDLISGYVYTLGPAGNRQRVEEIHSGRAVSYTYDDLYRLTEEDITDPVLGNETISYTYDNFGNRLTKTDSSGTITYSYDDNDRLVSEGSISYEYDANGNMLSKGDTVSYSYDYENRLVSMEGPDGVTEYAYDADGIRVRSVADGVVTNYLVDKNRAYAQVLEERDDSGSLIVSYVYGDDLISQNRDGSVSYYHYDGLGSTRSLTDAAGNVTDTYVYEAFGDLLYSTGDTPSNYLFTGEQYDPNAGFYYLRARYYDSDSGRFLTRDIWKGRIYEPVSLHKYIYVYQNPANNIDPSGKYTVLSHFLYKVLPYVRSIAGLRTSDLGKLAHRAIYEDIHDNWPEPTAVPEFPVPSGGRNGGVGRVDIAVLPKMFMYEIKPLGGGEDPIAQLERYEKANPQLIRGVTAYRGTVDDPKLLGIDMSGTSIDYSLTAPGVISYSYRINNKGLQKVLIPVAISSGVMTIRAIQLQMTNAMLLSTFASI